MITGRDIIFLSSLEWGRLWQAHHELATRLSVAGNRVLYIENVGFRTPALRDGRRVAARVKTWARERPAGGARQVAPDLFASAPLLAPPYRGRLARTLNRRLLVPGVARTAARLGLRDPIIWAFLPTDTTLQLVNRLRTPGSVLLYSCLADFESLSDRPERVASAEMALLRDCDAVFALPRLIDRCAQSTPAPVHRFEPGVALETFRPEIPPRPDLAALPRPMIGYAGGLHRHLDTDLLLAAARARPNWSWVFAGPVEEPVAELAALGNVHLLGHVPHNELAPVISSFDVGAIPYRLSPYIQSAVPTKLREYLAMGKPAVSTELPSVLDIAHDHDVVITTPSRPASFVDALESALELGKSAGTAGRCRQVAAPHAWAAKLDSMMAALELNVDFARAA